MNTSINAVFSELNKFYQCEITSSYDEYLSLMKIYILLKDKMGIKKFTGLQTNFDLNNKSTDKNYKFIISSPIAFTKDQISYVNTLIKNVKLSSI